MYPIVGQQHRTEGKHKSLSDDLQNRDQHTPGSTEGGVSKLRTSQETDLPGGEHVLTSLQRLPWVPASQLKHCPMVQDLELALHVGPYLSRMIDENVDARN